MSRPHEGQAFKDQHQRGGVHHVHSEILSLSLVSYCIEVAQELEVLEHFKHKEEHRAADGFA